MTASVVEHAIAGTPVPEPYDFRRPAAIPRERMRRLESAFATFADRWSTSLAARLRTDVAIEPVSLTVLDYRELVDRVGEDDALVLCAVPGAQERGVIQLPVAGMHAWIARLLGGSPGSGPGRATLTVIEQALVRRLLDEAFDDLRYAFTGFLPIDLAVVGFPLNARLASAARPDDAMLVAGFSVTVADDRVVFVLSLPASAVGSTGEPSAAAPSTDDPAALLRAQIVTVPVELALRLQPAPVGPATVLDLAVGDVIPIPHPRHRPLDLAVDGHIVAHAAIGAQSGQIACVVVDLEETE